MSSTFLFFVSGKNKNVNVQKKAKNTVNKINVYSLVTLSNSGGNPCPTAMFALQFTNTAKDIYFNRK